MGIVETFRQNIQKTRDVWFSPGTPIAPINPPGTPPYRFDYARNQNVGNRPRSEMPSLRSYDDIRSLARGYAVNAACISTRVREIQALNWIIQPRDKDCVGMFKSDIQRITDFFHHPEQDDLTYSDWLSLLLRDRLEIDALTLYRRVDRLDRFYSLEVIDGSTIKPILDEYGRVQGYQQYKSGIQSGNFKRPESGMDPNVPFLTKSEILYKPYTRITDSPYGISPVEQAYELIKTLVYKQAFDQDYFTEGNIPLMMVNFPAGDFTPDQVETFSEKFTAILDANMEARNRVLFQPYDAHITELKRFEYNTELERYALQITCAVHNMPPAELGITDDVNRASSDGQENLNSRKGTVPLAKSLKSIFDFVIQNEEYLNAPHLEWKWAFGETEDKLGQANTDQIYISNGVFKPQEIRGLRQDYLAR